VANERVKTTATPLTSSGVSGEILTMEPSSTSYCTLTSNC
jgi:hypothetical protein